MKRLSLISAALFAAITIAVVLAGSGSAQEPGEQTIRLVERASSDSFVDNPPRGTQRNRRLSGGDFAVATAPLFDESNTERVGTLHTVCFATRGGRFARVTFQCNGTAALAQGTLALNLGGRFGGEVTAAITGGTGAFEGRRGSVVSRERPNSNLIDDTIHLLP
jgi:hypothetical protein